MDKPKIIKTMSDFKETIGSRVSPELKRRITEEASERGMTASAYVETLLQNRTPPVEIVDRLKDIEFRIDILECNMEEFMPGNDGKENLEEEIEKGTKELVPVTTPVFGATVLALDEENSQEAFIYLNRLKEEYPDYSEQHLVITALWAALRNEKTVFQVAIRQAPGHMEGRLKKVGEYGE